MKWTDWIILAAAIVTIVVGFLAFIDFFINRWKYFKLFGHWFHKQLLRFMGDQGYVTLKIPAPAPAKPARSSTVADALARIADINLTDIKHDDGAELKRPVDAAPHVDLIFELPKNHGGGPGWRVRDEQMRVVNTSDTIAYDVAIQPKETPLYRAEFETIPRLEKGRPAYAVMKLRAKATGVYYSQFEAFLKFELEDSSDEENFNVRVPVVVQFYDAKKEILYQTTHQVIYDGFWHEAHVQLVQGTVPIKLPFSHAAKPAPLLPDVAGLVNTGPSPNKRLIKNIMRGTEKLMAWEIIRAGFPKCYFVEFVMRDKEPQAYITVDYKEANEQWHEWYKVWKQQPGSFGGSSGTGLDGTLPW
ncbi:MAG: hypothetical protein WBR10_20700 [Candidatus Acidiferrum sp.]